MSLSLNAPLPSEVTPESTGIVRRTAARDFAAVVGVVVAMPHFLRYWAGNARIPKVANGKFLHQRLEADQMVQVRMRGID